VLSVFVIFWELWVQQKADIMHKSDVTEDILDKLNQSDFEWFIIIIIIIGLLLLLSTFI